MFPCMFEALAHAAGYKVSAIGLAPRGSRLNPNMKEAIDRAAI